jgi:imidazolonepropionase-like amidohydrolase
MRICQTEHRTSDGVRLAIVRRWTFDVRRSTFGMAVALVLTATAYAAPFLPGKPQERPIALVGGTVHPVDGPEIAGGTVLFDKGKIVAVGRDVKLPEGTETIDVKGKHVYPGLVESFTELGLAEIEAVRATLDQREVGPINPNARAIAAVNPDSELIPVARANGILTAASVPRGGLIAGTSAVIHLDGWSNEDMAVVPALGVHLNWPGPYPVIQPYPNEPIMLSIEKREKAVQQIKEAFADARAYYTAKRAGTKDGREKGATGSASATKVDTRWEAMVPLFERKLRLVIHADDITQIQPAVAFGAKENLRMILLGGYDAPRCADLLKKHDVPVIIPRVYRLPLRRDDDYDAAFTLPERLREAGIKFCISGGLELGNERNLPYHAAYAAAYGLPRDEALKAVTLYPAEILGIGDRLGSLTKGKDATLIVTDGDILEIASHVERAFIGGRSVDLTDRQKLLYQKYLEKYRRQAR